MRGERVLITGASSGIGLELANQFAADGSDLILVARTESKLTSLAAGLQGRHGITARILVKDLTLPNAPREILDDLTRDGLPVDILVNNAGFGLRGTAAALSAQRQLEMIQVNVTALTELTLRFLPGMLERKKGGILNVASTAAFQPGPYMTVYYATKAYVLSFTEGLAEELRGTGVQVTCLAPGATHTEFAAAAGMENTRLFRFGPLKAAAVARAGYRGFRAGRLLVVPGIKDKLGVFLVRFAPRLVVRKVTRFLNS